MGRRVVTTLRIITGTLLVGVGVGFAASPEIGGLVTIGFCLFVAGVALVAGAVLDVLEVD